MPEFTREQEYLIEKIGTPGNLNQNLYFMGLDESLIGEEEFNYTPQNIEHLGRGLKASIDKEEPDFSDKMSRTAGVYRALKEEVQQRGTIAFRDLSINMGGLTTDSGELATLLLLCEEDFSMSVSGCDLMIEQK